MTSEERNFRIMFAGFFMGEGSIGIYRTSRQWKPTLTFYQADAEVMDDVQRRLGGTRFELPNGVISLNWSHRQAVRVARFLHPYLRYKWKLQCDAFLYAMKHWGSGKRGRSGCGWLPRNDGRRSGPRFLSLADQPDLESTRQNLANSVNKFNKS